MHNIYIYKWPFDICLTGKRRSCIVVAADVCIYARCCCARVHEAGRTELCDQNHVRIAYTLIFILMNEELKRHRITKHKWFLYSL